MSSANPPSSDNVNTSSADPSAPMATPTLPNNNSIPLPPLPFGQYQAQLKYTKSNTAESNNQSNVNPSTASFTFIIRQKDGCFADTAMSEDEVQPGGLRYHLLYDGVMDLK
jgi:hypothetical protein